MRKRLQREGEQRMLQRKSRIQPELWDTAPTEKKYVLCCLTHSLLSLLKDSIYTLAVVPWSSIREGIDQRYQFLLVVPLPVASGNTQSMEGVCTALPKQNLSAQSHYLVPCDQLKLDVIHKKGIWKPPHQSSLRSRCDSEQNNFPYTVYYS